MMIMTMMTTANLTAAKMLLRGGRRDGVKEGGAEGRGVPYLLRKAACCTNNTAAAESGGGRGGGGDRGANTKVKLFAHGIKVGEIVKGTIEDAFNPRKETVRRRGHDTVHSNQIEGESRW